ncbi:conserved hypothetical protein [Flavobacterium psychrophilum]|uniref:hypothetical protein n=1 Tax=Flavobacterium psychrophilum TaxID=96345 RepID=UPI000B7C173C|nr:hypothetical protein [Flavobacterium psychrophilum]SNB42870.1 conserved hypothetical protein [Flavobacterium psychrophilum]
MNNIDQILEKNYEQLDILKSELSNLKEIKNRIEVLIGSNDKLPIIFSELFDKINKVTNDFTNVLGNSVNVFLEGNNDLLTKNNTDFSNKISELSAEITRLVEVDFNALFKDLETKFLENSKLEIGKELKKFDEKTNNLQNKIDNLGKEITRLSKIDLEEHFNKHQSKLSEVFISVNGINGILTTISQNINKIIQNFGDIEQTLSKNQKEINQGFDIVKENQDKTTNDLLNKIKESDTKLDAIVSQNEALKKELDFNKKLNFAIIVLVRQYNTKCVS